MCGAGLLLAVALAVLSTARVSVALPPQFHPRQKATYQSQSSIMITEPGFPIGSVSEVNDTNFNQFASLTDLYVALGNSQQVQSLVKRATGSQTKIVATAQYATLPSGYEVPVPIMTFTAVGGSPHQATTAAAAATRLFQHFVEKQQVANAIPKRQRIVLQALAISSPTPVGGPKKTLPILIFIIVIVGVVALALILENLRPRVTATASPATSEPVAPDAPAVSARRSA